MDLIGLKLLISVLVLCNIANGATNNDLIEGCEDEKGFKNMLKARPNLLVLFSKSGKKKIKPITKKVDFHSV
jgi:hypothetical protein